MSDPLDTSAAVANYLQARKPEDAARTSLTLAAGSNPDAEAEYRRLAREAGIPLDSVRDNKEAVQQRVSLPDFNDLATKFPSTTKYLSTLENARIAHDDVGTLSAIEQAIRAFDKPPAVLKKLVKGGQFKSEGANALRYVGELGKQAVMGATAGVGAGIFDVAAMPLDFASGLTKGILPQDIPGMLASDYRYRANRARAAMDAYSAPADSNIAKGFQSGFRSAGQNIVLLPIGLAGGATAMAGTMAGMVGAQEFSKAREEGLSQVGALTYAIPQAAFEYAFEKLPASMLLEDIAKHSKVGTMIARQLAPEVLGEQATTVLQDLNEWVRLNPSKSVSEFIAERPDAAVQTLVATLVGVGVHGGAVRGIQKAVGGVAEREARAAEAQQAAVKAQEFVTLIDQSKLRQRDPEALAQFVAQVSESGDTPTEVYIDAAQLVNTLNQSAVTIEQLRAFAPAVAAQLEAAQQVPGADIRVPMGELAAVPSNLTAALIEHMRENPQAMSSAEAQAYLKDEGAGILAEVEKTVGDEVQASQFEQDKAAVAAQFETQLNAVGKFRPEVNKAYAGLLGNFYAAQALRAGVPLSEFVKTYDLQIAGKDALGAQRLEQVTPEQALDTNVEVEMPLVPEFTEAVANTAGAQVTPDGLILNVVRWQKPEQEGAQAIRTGVFYLPAGSPNGRYYKTSVTSKAPPNPYGGTEKMEGKTLIRRPLFVKGATGGKAPEAAYDTVMGKGAMEALDKAVLDVISSRGWMNKMESGLFEERVKQFLTDHGANPGMAWVIIQNSRQGNTLRFALRENVIAHAVREAGFDAVLGYSKGKAGASISEVFDVREQTFPSSVLSAEIHERFLSQSPAPTSEGAPERATQSDTPVQGGRSADDIPPGDTVELFHGSPESGLSEIDDRVGSLFGGVFASASKNSAESHGDAIYSVNLPINSVLTQHDLDYEIPAEKVEAALRKAMPRLNDADYETAYEAVIDDRAVKVDDDELTRIFRADDAGEAGWEAQRIRGQVARALGYKAVEMNDEHGTSYLVLPGVKLQPNESPAPTNDGAPERVDQTDTPEFKAWFKGSKVVDAEGKPLVVYHGTGGNVSTFDPTMSGKSSKTGAPAGSFFFTNDPEVASSYTVAWQDDFSQTLKDGANVMPVMLSLQKPLKVSAKGENWRSVFYKGEYRDVNEIVSIAQESGKYDGVIVTRVLDHGVGATSGKPSTTYVAFNPTQIKSATGNRGTFDPSDPNILNQQARGALAFGDDITASPSVIALLEGADLSTFIHEAGHFFLEVQADLAARIQTRISAGESVSDGERRIVADMDQILTWFGITADAEGSGLDRWAQMSLEQKREHHEQWARGFERFAMEGKAPSQELQSLFAKFRSWMVQVYKTLTGLNVKLTDDVREVMGRMLATDEAIEQAKQAASMGPLYESAEQAGMTPAEYADYQAMGARSTNEASAELDARLMRDMKWLSRARNKAIKAAQAEANNLRKEVEREVRADVMAQPVYQAWQFLTGKADQIDRKKSTGPVGEDVDNIFTAIAKAGGLDRDEVRRKWGVPLEEKLDSGVFGSPVVRKTGGMSIDAMAERMVEMGYLLPDEFGRAELDKFEALFDDQRRGIDRYSISKEYAGEAPVESLDLPKIASGKLRSSSVKEVNPAAYERLSKLRMTSEERGIEPDIVAETFGFTSGDHLIKELASAQVPKEVIAEQVDQIMLERYGDITSDEALNIAADEAVHNEIRARVVATELRALEKAGRAGPRSTVAVMAKAAKDYAYQIIARQRVRDLRPGQYSAAQARSARLAKQAMGKSVQEVAMHKRNELINTYATRAAYDAQAEVKAMQVYFRKFDKRIKSIDAGYQDQIDQMLERFDFKNASLKQIDKRKSFAAWYAEQEDAGNPPDVPEGLLNESRTQSFKDMTVEELRGLRDTVKQIEHMGRLKNKLLLAKGARDFDAIADDITRSIVANGGEARSVQLEGPNPVMDWFAGAAAAHRKLASLIRQMDGNKDSGPMYENMGRAMNERGTMEDVMVEKATIELQNLYAPLLKMRGGITGYKSKVYIPEIGDSLTRGGRLAVALNWGNEANRQRVMDGDKWSQAQVQAILKTLSVQELQFVNNVWAYIDSYWDDIAAKEKRLTGIEPEKVDALPFETIAADGTEVKMRGGYYPLKYDTDRSDRADTQEAAQAAKEMMEGVTTRATTRRGHTKERLKEVKRAVRKDLNVITQHVTQVVHDLAWHEWLIDTNKILKDERVVSAIRDHYGPRVLKTMRDDVMGIATADVAPQTDIDKALLMLRSNVSRATMGASLTTAFLQPFGLTQSMVRIGGRHVLRGVARWGGEAVRMENTIKWIYEKSDFMRLRGKTFNKELREIRGAVGGKSKTMQAIDGGLFYMMQKMQAVADVPTWVGQYEKSIAEGLDESAAVAMADRAVLESQGGGQTKDLAEVQRKHPMLTQFYSYFSVTLNLAIEQTAATDFKNPRAVAGWVGDMALLMVIPAILPAFIMYAIKGGDGDDDEKAWAKRIAEWQVGYLMGTVVGARELSGSVSGFDYGGPPVGRAIGDAGKLGKQVSQGEVDEPAVLALINLMGSLFGIPTVQALRSYRGWKAWDEGQEGAGPQSALFGPPPKD
jgi:hypothetical protein